MKILMANIPAGGQNSPAGAFIRSVLVPLWRRNYALVQSATTEIAFSFASSGTIHPAFADCRYLPELNAEAMVQAVRGASSAGFDAVLMTCFGDPGLWGVRGAVDIPVVSIGEASLLAASMMAHRFGIVSPSALLIEPIRRQVERYGWGNRLVGIEATEDTAREQEESLVDAHSAIHHFTIAARRLIAAGAQVLIPACGLMSPCLRLAPNCAGEFPNGLVAVDSVPIVDVLGVSLAMAELMARMKQCGSSWGNPRGFSEFAATVDDEAFACSEGAPPISIWNC